ncbi:MAG: hypothetical protein KDC55_12250 [Ignavibacteriae bacterium]|nr:hypothetical protein [Flavobacteriaceae bacterium]MCB0703469.1 hypothetical protein [Ignavibacteriota bacterium]
MAVSIHELFMSVNLPYNTPVKWNTPLDANYPGIYVISLTKDPYDKIASNYKFELNNETFLEWKKEANYLSLEEEKIEQLAPFQKYLSQFWNPDENILYIGQSSSSTHSISKRVLQYYKHKLGQKGPHNGGYWLKLLKFLESTFVFYSKAENPKETEFKMLLKYIELSTGKSIFEIPNLGAKLPFANLNAELDKVHSIKNPTNRNKREKKK